jgi:hypothetical protein
MGVARGESHLSDSLVIAVWKKIHKITKQPHGGKS